MSVSNVTAALAGVLADTYVLQVKTQNYHWNVVGPYFPVLHTLFENQYNELFAAVDELAERIRQLGDETPGTMAEFLRLTVISEESATSAAGMVADLAACNAKLIARLESLLQVAQKAEDDSSQDLAIRRLNAHQKAEWMLKATLGAEATGPQVKAEASTPPVKVDKKATTKKTAPKPAKAEKAKQAAPVNAESKKPSKKKGRVAFG